MPCVFKGKKIFVESSREVLLHKIDEEGGILVNDRVAANIIVKDEVLTAPGLRNSLSMMLVGGCLVSTSYLLEGKGAVIAYKRLTRTPKHVFLSDGFKKEYPGAVRIIEKVVDVQPKPKQWNILSLERLWDLDLVCMDWLSSKFPFTCVSRLSY